MADLPEVLVASRAAWREWLGRHHASAGAWVVLAKKGRDGSTTLDYEEAVEEALCHGWIDGQVKRRDDETYLARFTPRRPGSAWSASNVARIGRLEAAGLLHAAGLAEVERARADGRWARAERGALRRPATDSPPPVSAPAGPGRSAAGRRRPASS